MNKTLLLASFIFPDKLDGFINYLNTTFGITKDKIFCYNNLDDVSKLIVTFKFTVPDGKYMNLRELFQNAVTIHKRGNALYTINALNKIIELSTDVNIGNLDYKSYKIDWGKYQDKLILTNNDDLIFFNIIRIF